MQKNTNIDKNIPFIRFNHLGKDKKIISNIFGENIVLTNAEFDRYILGKIDKSSELYKTLDQKMFFYKDGYDKNAIEEYKKRFAVNFIGPTLHIIVLTKGCNHQCLYCHAAADYRYTDDSLQLSKENAQKIVDTILSSPSQNLTIEFQGGEPLVNMEILEYIINYSEQQNKTKNKKIKYALVSNLTMITEEILVKLFSFPNLTISTSLDGDKQIHDFNRLMLGKSKEVSSFDTLVSKIKLIKKYELQKNRKILSGAMGVITKKSLPKYKEIVDTYKNLGLNSIFLKKMNSLGFAGKSENILGYSKEDLKTFYINYFSYLIELYEKGTFIRDGFLAILVSKITDPAKTNFMDLRSPCGAGIGQIAYDYTGKIYTCDEGRMIDDDTFQIGDTSDDLKTLVQNDIVGAMMDASTIESLPCDICAYAPFCGVCPIESYQQRGNIYTNQVFDGHCDFFMFLFDWIFAGLADKNSKQYKYLQKYSSNSGL